MTRNPSDDRQPLSAAYQSKGAAEAWQRGAAARAGAMTAVTSLMLDLAGVAEGSRVLDVAAGTGEQTLLAAERVGAGGSVLAMDIAPEMLRLAAEAASKAGYQQVRMLVADAQRLHLEAATFDAAICRSGLMLMDDPVAALRCIRRALRPGGKLAVLVFGPSEQNPLQWLPTRIARTAAGVPLPAPCEPGMFALGEPGVLERAFQAGGFHDVRIESVPTARQFPSAAIAVSSLRDSLPSVHAVLSRLESATQEAAWQEIEQALRALEGPDGLRLTGSMLLGVGSA